MKNKNLLKPIYLLLFALILSACIGKPVQHCKNCTVYNDDILGNKIQSYICTNADSYKGKVVGDGHCVSLIKRCSTAPNTEHWRPGQTVRNNNLEQGTVIATFKNGRYPNISGYHAAIYIKQDENGIWVWDQWQGKPVHQRLIRWREDDALHSNTGQSYKVVRSARAK